MEEQKDFCPISIRSTPHIFRAGDAAGTYTYLNLLIKMIVNFPELNKYISIVKGPGDSGGFIQFYNITKTNIYKYVKKCRSGNGKLYYAVQDSPHEIFHKLFETNSYLDIQAISRESEMYKGFKKDDLMDYLLRSCLRYTDLELVINERKIHAELYLVSLIWVNLENILETYKFEKEEDGGYIYYKNISK